VAERRAAALAERGGGAMIAIGRALVLVAAFAIACGGEESPSAGAPAPLPVAVEQDAAAQPPLGGLRAWVGKYPRDVGLFESEPLHGRLVALLGERYPELLANMGTQGPIAAEGAVLYVIGNKPHAGGASQAVLLVDVDRDLVHVHLLEEQEMAELRERDEEIPWPDDVATTISNWQELAREGE